STQDNQDTKIDLEKVVLDESIKNNQEVKIEIKDEIITKDLQKDIQILKSNEDKEISNQNSSQNIESQVVASVVDLETQKVETKIDTKEEIVPLITKEYVVDSQDNQNINSKKSLMDILIEKNSKNPMLNILENETIIKTELEQSKDFLSNLYLGGQKNLLNSQFLLNKSEAINILKNANSLTDIEKSASILELGLQDVDVEQNVDLKTLELVKKQDLNNLDKKNLLDSLLMEKSIRSEDVKHLITKSIEASNALLENTLNVAEDVELSVNSPLSYNIQSRIIGAKQQMSTMMSDIARQMYENYRPPVTVFRINLNPLELGSIAILMKNDKNSNALTISMNASNGGTLEALVENQNVLRNSLNKTFDENTIFNLDFTSSNQNNQQSSNGQSNSNQQNRFEGQIDTQSVLQLKEENKDREDKVLDYM
ncbi:MAG: flagellar hook-length control protein FliK, partial [Erysipelotrichia bacterium]|nr:flagellar hook-length control protein FliK [Erysipelotrichia bacterium]